MREAPPVQPIVAAMVKTMPCPICRGEIHAVAGRCKHCKTDLVELRERAMRAARAQAMGATVPPRPMSPPPPTMSSPPSPSPQHQAIPAPFPLSPLHTDVEAPQPQPQPQPQNDTMAAPPPPQWGEPPAYFGPEVVSVRQQPSAWSRRWPMVVSAVALLAIGVSLGMLAERWRTGGSRSNGDGRMRNASTTPRMVPDHMPKPLLPGPSAPRQVPDPRAPDPTSPPSAQIAPQAPNMFGGPSPSPSPVPGGPQGGGDAGAFRAFTASLTDSLCTKLGECGADSGTQSICRAFAQQLDPEDAAAKVASGECSFNQKAADACLRAVSALRCDTAAATGMMDWLSQSQQVTECAEAYTCQ
jgi:hypothetical protein